MIFPWASRLQPLLKVTSWLSKIEFPRSPMIIIVGELNENASRISREAACMVGAF